jgi:flagellar hook-length control protein FliK
MALATNPLLTALTATNAHKASVNSSAKAPDPFKANASSFSDVFVKHAQTPPAVADKSPAKTDTAKTSSADNKPDAKDSSAATDKTVADSGNGLPAKPVTGKSESDKNGSDQAGSGSNKDNGDDSDNNAQAATDPTLIATPAVDPSQDPALLANQPVAPVVLPVDDKPAIDPAMLLSGIAAATVPAPVVTPPAAVTTDATDGKFDPSADPLAGLTAVQVALDNKAQQAAQNSKAVGGTGKSADDAGKTSVKQNPDFDPSQQLSGNLAALADQSIDKSTTEGGGDKAFSGLIADGLKDVKAATSDTRVDNFADRLAALSQAAAPVKTAAAAPAGTALMNQPLAMNQSGWSEGVVNRVMYLSSQNLKQADIQLEPAELGRLNIRVNMAADQQTQVTFMSAHVGVRDALESQMGRLRDSFNQQGMGQVDVNVSDQSQGWQQQAQQQQSGNGSQRSSASNGSGGVSGSDSIADGSPLDAATAASAPLTVIGSSAVDYYA